MTTGRDQTSDSFRDCGKEITKVTRSGVTVRVFGATRKSVQSYVLAYYLADERQRETFRGTLDAAKTRAEEIAKMIGSQQAANGVLPQSDVQTYLSAVASLKQISVTLPAAVAEYIAARQRIGNRPLADAADYYARHACLDMPQKSLAEVAQEMLDAKKTDGVSQIYRQQLLYAIQPACDVLTKPIAEISTAEIDDYLRSLTGASRSRHNVRSALVSVFEFAKSRGYIPNDRATAAMLSSRVRVKTGDVEIFSVKEMTALLGAADANMLPVLVLGGFCGIRSAEILRLDWKDVNFEQKHINISSAKAKTPQRRIVPLLPNALEWLSPYHNRTGPIVPYAKQRVNEMLSACAKSVDVTWKRNALRHSFASYRLAQINDAPKVSYEMGNSPQMIFRHYRELVTPQDAAAWWSISPKQAENIVPMSRQRATA